MGDVADYTMRWEEDEYAEDRAIVEDRDKGLSAGTIAAKYDISVQDVIDILDWVDGK